MFKNPIKTKSWNKILNHFNFIKNIKIIDLFKKDKNRFENFSKNFKNKILIDYSKNKINLETINLFLELLNEINFKDYILSMLNGENINFTENKPVLNFLLRDLNNKLLKKKKELLDYKKDIDANLSKIKFFTNKIINGNWLGYSGKKIKNIVNIGIGGSDFGPRMIIKSLYKYKINNNQKFYFISNIDVSEILELIKKISPENTLFIICSKSFTTIETLFNANISKKWILDYYDNNISSLNNHFILISSNFNEAIKFGVNLNNIFIVDDWVGGRYSYCSSFGLSISIFMGFKNFKKLLYGAHDVDLHFFNSNFENNIPILLAIISIWYNNFFNYCIEAILVYNNKLSFLPTYLQQLIMESNGKYVDYNGNYINNYYTSPIILGGIGTISQHSFFQLLHQGTYIIPCDFIVEISSFYNIDNSHLVLLSNFLSQTQSLAFGDKIFKNNFLNKKNINIYKFMRFKGNRPSNSILINKINPYSLGVLITLYEYKVFTQGVILNISSFDQWGVELGKKLSKFIYPCLKNKCDINSNIYKNKIYLDNSTLNLINYFKKNFNF